MLAITRSSETPSMRLQAGDRRSSGVPGDLFPVVYDEEEVTRTYVYRGSRPCAIGRECPHDRDPDDCEAANTEAAAESP